MTQKFKKQVAEETEQPELTDQFFFIPNAKLGDKLRINITKVGRRSTEAKVLGAADETSETE